MKDEERDELGRTPLHRACIRGSLATARRLLREGASPESADASGLTPVHLAIRHGKPRVLELLIRQGARLDVVDPEHGGSYLNHALQQRDPEIVILLAEAGAPIHLKDRFGWTPLWFAMGRWELAMVRYLLVKGASVHEANPAGLTPLEAALEAGDPELAELLREAGASEAPVPKRKPSARRKAQRGSR